MFLINCNQNLIDYNQTIFSIFDYLKSALLVNSVNLDSNSKKVYKKFPSQNI